LNYDNLGVRRLIEYVGLTTCLNYFVYVRLGWSSKLLYYMF